jgi:CBS-domain-containing membrane protein
MTSEFTDPRARHYDPGRVVGTCAADGRARHSPRIGERLRVADVMTAPAPTIDSDAPMLEVIHRITSGEAELVVTTDARPVGIITARGILSLLDPDNADWQPQRAIDLAPTGTPRLLPGLSVATAVHALNDGPHEALPVVDYRGDLIGILSQRQLIVLLVGERGVP